MREDCRRPDRIAVTLQLVHVRRVRRREDVGWRTLFDLRHQRGGAGEVELHGHACVARLKCRPERFERVRQRCRCEHGDLAAYRSRCRCGPGIWSGPTTGEKRRGDHEHGRAMHQSPPVTTGHLQLSGNSTITLVALTTATARTPGARPSSSAASREIKDTSR